jgi:hypothetical protein
MTYVYRIVQLLWCVLGISMFARTTYLSLVMHYYRSHASLDKCCHSIPQLRTLSNVTSVRATPCKPLPTVKKNRNKLRGLSAWANYTDRTTAMLVLTLADRGMSRSQWGGSPTAVISGSWPEPLLFLSSTSSIALTSLSGPHSRPTTFPKIW